MVTHSKNMVAPCNEYPCTILKRLDKSYEKRYQESLIDIMSTIQSKGIDYYLSIEKERLKCPKCGHELNLHDKICCECSQKSEVESLDEFLKKRSN